MSLCTKLGDWSSGMIPASGAGGREFDSRITPFVSNKKIVRTGTRTQNLLLRRQAPYPLGHKGDHVILLCCVALIEKDGISDPFLHVSLPPLQITICTVPRYPIVI
jgi:hypothetical protein